MAPLSLGLLVLVSVCALHAVEGRQCENNVIGSLGVTFQCPSLLDSDSDIYCCGPEGKRYCCSNPLKDEWVLMLAIIVGVAAVAVMSLLGCCACCCCCPCCFLYRRRHGPALV